MNADISLKEKVETTVDNKSPLFGTGSSSSRVAKESSNIAAMNPPNIETDEDIGDREVETYMYAPDHMMKRYDTVNISCIRLCSDTLMLVIQGN